MHVVLKVALEAVPVIIMIGLIPLTNEIALTALYGALIVAFLMFKHRSHDISALCIGIVVMTLSELFFLTTGVETFTEHTLFGVMPLWLPLLWGYGFVAIKRGVVHLQYR